MSEKPPAKLSKILSNRINFIIANILKLRNIQESLYFIMPTSRGYRYALLIDIC